MYSHSATTRYNWSLGGEREAAVPVVKPQQPTLESLKIYHADSFGWALACCFWSRDSAEDALQESYLRVLEGSAKFAGNSSPKTWFFGIVKRVAAQSHRREKRHSELDLHWISRDQTDVLREVTPAACTMAEMVSAQETSQQLAACLMLLSERQREVLHLIFYSELTLEEASQILQVSLGSARTHYHRGKQRLAQLLDEVKIDSGGDSDEK